VTSLVSFGGHFVYYRIAQSRGNHSGGNVLLDLVFLLLLLIVVQAVVLVDGLLQCSIHMVTKVNFVCRKPLSRII
jgi:hypothetical protein